LTSREKRFIKFASVEYHGQLYMTPQDFLESFVDEQPRGINKSTTYKIIRLFHKLLNKICTNIYYKAKEKLLNQFQ